MRGKNKYLNINGTVGDLNFVSLEVEVDIGVLQGWNHSRLLAGSLYTILIQIFEKFIIFQRYNRVIEENQRLMHNKYLQ